MTAMDHPKQKKTWGISSVLLNLTSKWISKGVSNICDCSPSWIRIDVHSCLAEREHVSQQHDQSSPWTVGCWTLYTSRAIHLVFTAIEEDRGTRLRHRLESISLFCLFIQKQRNSPMTGCLSGSLPYAPFAADDSRSEDLHSWPS